METATLKLEVVQLEKQHWQTLGNLSREMRELHNFVWRQWEAWHTANDTPTKLREMLSADKAWREADKTTRGERRKWSVKPWPNDFAKELYHATKCRFRSLNSRVIVLALQKLRGTVTTKNSSSKGGLKWWIAIMLDMDGRGTALHPQPIPLDTANAAILASDECGQVMLEFRVDRIERPEKKTGTSTLMRCRLKTGGKRAGYAQPAHEMANGKRKLAGSQLVYDWRHNKWFACLTYEREARTIETLDENCVAILKPGKKNCWLFRYGGYTRRIFGRGHHVGHKRKSLLLQRWGRQSSYRDAPPRKGKGRDRALVPLFKLTTAWNSFTRRMNDELTAFVLEKCRELGIGRVVLAGGDERCVRAVTAAVKDH